MVSPDTTLRDVASKMYVQSVGAFVVGTSSHPAGVISERDVVRMIGQGADPDQATAKEAMSSHFVWVRPGDLLFEAASQMMESEVRHLPVLDDADSVVAMISVLDLLQPLLLDAWGG